MLSKWAIQKPQDGYMGGNLLNLLLSLDVDLTGENFSNIPVWNADLQNAELHHVNFTNSNLLNSSFAETLSSIHSISSSPDGKYLVKTKLLKLGMFMVNSLIQFHLITNLIKV